MTDAAYFPARNFAENVLKRMGVETTYYDPAIGAGIAELIRPNTKAVLAEAPGSQSLEMQDIPAISAAAQRAGVCVIMDNTWATPLFFPPHAHGVDMAVEAGTKYLSGHSDLLLGLVSANAEWFPRLRNYVDLFAIPPGPEDVFLALRGLRTMDLRLREAERQGLALARWLQARPEVLRVIHPALPDYPGHDIWKRDFSGSSGLFSIVLKPVAGGGGRGDARRARIVRHGLFLGRLRKPRDSVRLLDLPHRDALGARRADAALLGRARGYRGFEGGSGSRLCAATGGGELRSQAACPPVAGEARGRFRVSPEDVTRMAALRIFSRASAMID